jgi:hypothetical protein
VDRQAVKISGSTRLPFLATPRAARRLRLTFWGAFFAPGWYSAHRDLGPGREWLSFPSALAPIAARGFQGK